MGGQPPVFRQLMLLARLYIPSYPIMIHHVYPIISQLYIPLYPYKMYTSIISQYSPQISWAWYPSHRTFSQQILFVSPFAVDAAAVDLGFVQEGRKPKWWLQPGPPWLRNLRGWFFSDSKSGTCLKLLGVVIWLTFSSGKQTKSYG